MKIRNIVSLGLLGMPLCAVFLLGRPQQDRSTLKAPNGVAFSEFKGYETWEAVAPSETDEGIKMILANPVMMKAYREGVPGNGKPFPEGSMTVKIEWAKRSNPESPYSVTVPGVIKSISFIEKDSKRFPNSSGYGYAQFNYDPATSTLKAFGKDASFNNTCYQCHTIVKTKDYIFTEYPRM